ncbi:hypothetical protein Tco_1490943 [Tanacetum coccineum]
MIMKHRGYMAEQEGRLPTIEYMDLSKQGQGWHFFSKVVQQDRGPARCAFKVDIQKAYDTVDWGFLKVILTSLCFADNLFLFAHGDVNSAKVIMEELDEFKLVSGLVHSLPKSTGYFCNVLNYVNLAILNILPFEEGKLPVKYLGVPLVSTRLLFRDCKELVEKASMFILPSHIMCDLEQLMRGFLWCHGDMLRGKDKVAWEVVCLPKKEGGLGVRRLDVFYKALIASHIWRLEENSPAPPSYSSFYLLSFRGWNWVWPIDWYVKYPLLNMYIVPRLFLTTLDQADCFGLVWDHLNTFAGLPNSSASLDSIVDMLIPISKKKSARSVTAKLVFALSFLLYLCKKGTSKYFSKNKMRMQGSTYRSIMTHGSGSTLLTMSFQENC